VTTTVRCLLSVLCLVAAGCDCGDLKSYGQKAKKLLEEDKPAKPEKTEPVDADFVIEGTKLFYKGKRLMFGRPVDDWVKVLGPYNRCLLSGIRDGRGAYAVVWDNVGLTCGVYFGQLDECELVFRDNKFPEIKLRHWPKRYHSKPILVDGAVIDKDTPTWKYNLHKRGERFEPRILSKYEYFVEEKGFRYSYSIWLSKKERMISFSCWRSRIVPSDYRDPRKPPTRTPKGCCSLLYDAIKAERVRPSSTREVFVDVCTSLPPTVVYCFDPAVPTDEKNRDCPETLRDADKQKVEKMTKVVRPP
jgi:hypothetical protein